MQGATLFTYLCGNLTIKWRNLWLCAGESDFDSLRLRGCGPTQNLLLWISGVLIRESMWRWVTTFFDKEFVNSWICKPTLLYVLTEQY